MGYEHSFDGTWEELIRKPDRFAGKHIHVAVVDDQAQEEFQVVWARAMEVVKSFRGSFGPVAVEASSTENLYD